MKSIYDSGMLPGAKLDLEIARRIFRYRTNEQGHIIDSQGKTRAPFKWSTNFERAWSLLEALRIYKSIKTTMVSCEDGGWEVTLRSLNTGKIVGYAKKPFIPHAICVAALGIGGKGLIEDEEGGRLTPEAIVKAVDMEKVRQMSDYDIGEGD